MDAAEKIRAPEDWLALGRERARGHTGGTADPHGLGLVLAASDFVHAEFERNPALLAALLDDGRLTRDLDAPAYRELTARAIADHDDEAALMTALRRLRRAEMVRVAWRDIAGLANFETCAGEASALADAIIDAALERVESWTAARYGEPLDADGRRQRLVVFALGKLGAGELNFSSDIDLIFGFAEPGTTQGARSVDHDEYYTRVARRLIKVLGEVTQEGFVYRVDMRLRPFGTQGPMATSFGALEHYYQTHGRDWERYAWIRTRVVAGDAEGGARMLVLLRPFIYRRYLDFGALASLREMKTLINAEVRRGGLEHNIKLGPGGIREVEFIAQAFQLVRGGRLPALRGRKVARVLERLPEYDLLPAFAATGLAGAYVFLRTLEHRLQQVADQQVHTLPLDPGERARIALASGFDSWESLARRLSRQREMVHSHFDQVFGLDDEDRDAADEPLAALVEGDMDEGISVELLQAAGFGDAAPRAFELIRSLRGNLHVRHLGERGRQRFVRLLPPLLRAAAATAAPAVTLARLCDVMQAIAPRSTYMALLDERPLALSQLVRLCAASAMIAQHIRRYPLVIDELLDSRTLYAPLRRDALRTELAERLQSVEEGDLEQEMETLRREKQTNVLRVAAADVVDALPLMVVSDHLTDIAEVCVEHALAITWRDLTTRHGTPGFVDEGERHEAGVAVIAYGKLGGIELGYASDLDLVYIHGSRGSQQVTSGPRVVDNQLFFARLAQRLAHVVTTHTPSGVLYELDIRLRPNGNKGLPAVSLDGFAHYQREEAWTWEHQALVRARCICGDRVLGERFAEVRREILTRERDGETLREEVRHMRERMLAHHGSRDPGRFDLKQSRGGIADIEFIVQYLVLRWPSAIGRHLEYTDNIRLLDGIAAGGVLPAADTETLADAYRAYRARVHELALQEADAIVGADEFREERGFVTALWARLLETPGPA